MTNQVPDTSSPFWKPTGDREGFDFRFPSDDPHWQQFLAEVDAAGFTLERKHPPQPRSLVRELYEEIGNEKATFTDAAFWFFIGLLAGALMVWLVHWRTDQVIIGIAGVSTAMLCLTIQWFARSAR